MAITSRGTAPRQQPWPTEDIVEVVHTAITDLMEADLEKAGLDPAQATRAENAVMFNIASWHIGQGQDGTKLVADLNRERNRDDLVCGLDELNQYITDHAQDFLTWGRLPDHHASPVIELVPNPFYLDRLAYLCLAVATEFAERGTNALHTLRKFGLEVDGTRGDLDNAWLESGTAHEHLTSAVNAIEQIMAHPIAGDRLPDTHNLDPERTLRNDAVRDAISIRPPETRLAGDLKLHFDHSGNLTEIERPLDRDTGTTERIVIGEERFSKMLNWPAVAKAISRYEAEHRNSQIVANCQVCGADIHDTGHRDLTCPNGCDHLKGDRVTCPAPHCQRVVPGIFAHCPGCGESLDGAEVFVD